MGLSYIKGFQNPGTTTHLVFIDPMHIGAACDVRNGSDGAIRVKQYFVFGTLDKVNRSIYHSSEYGKWTDDEYRQMLKEVVEQTAMKGEELEKFQQEANALV